MKSFIMINQWVNCVIGYIFHNSLLSTNNSTLSGDNKYNDSVNCYNVELNAPSATGARKCGLCKNIGFLSIKVMLQ